MVAVATQGRSVGRQNVRRSQLRILLQFQVADSDEERFAVSSGKIVNVTSVTAAFVLAALSTLTPRAADLTLGTQALARVQTPAGRNDFVRTYCLDCHSSRLKTGGLV